MNKAQQIGLVGIALFLLLILIFGVKEQGETGDPELDKFYAKQAQTKAENEAKGIRDVTLDKGPAAAAQQLWTNVTGGKGVTGLITPDGRNP